MTVTPVTPGIRWTTVFLDVPRALVDDEAAYWEQVTATTPSTWRGGHRFVTLLPADGDAHVRVQALDAGGPASHLDLHVEDVGVGTVAAEGLGAVVQHTEPGLSVLVSPGGLPFCLVAHAGESVRPRPVRWSGGHRSRLDQLCLDVPPALYDGECAFWAALTGWELRDGRRPEFRFLARPDGMPLRLLVQRLDDAGPGAAVTAHVDLACDDTSAEVRRHEALGATVVRQADGWTTLQDPAGLEYCVTGRDPNV